MVRWRLTGAEGTLAGVPLVEVLGNGGMLTGGPEEVRTPGGGTIEQAWFEKQVRGFPGRASGCERPTWIILPDRQRSRRHLWQDLAADQVEIGFGRSGVTLALGQINRLQAPATIVAIDRVPGTTPETATESRLRVNLEPDQTGLGLRLNLVDGRLDGDTDMNDLLVQARAVVTAPEVLFLPGTGSDASLDRLMPSLPALGNWVDRDVRWEFPEARIGPLGAVGSLFNWYWLHEGYRLGDWQGPAAILDMDSNPLVGLSVVDYNA